MRPLAERRTLPDVRLRPRALAREAAPLEVRRGPPEAPVQPEGRDHPRGLAAAAREVAARPVADRQLQERRVELRDWPRDRRDAEDRVVHGPPDPARAAPWVIREDDVGSRGRRDLHRRQGPEHAQRATQAPHHRARSGRQDRRARPAQAGARGRARYARWSSTTGRSRPSRARSKGALRPGPLSIPTSWRPTRDSTPCTPTGSLTTPSSTSTRTCTSMAWRTSGALLKRALGGTYVSVEPFHLFRYLDDQA